MVSKAVLSSVTLTLGLLAPAPSVLRLPVGEWRAVTPAALVYAAPRLARTIAGTARPECGGAPQELRFEMLPKDADARPPPPTASVCLAVYELDGATARLMP